MGKSVELETTPDVNLAVVVRSLMKIFPVPSPTRLITQSLPSGWYPQTHAPHFCDRNVMYGLPIIAEKFETECQGEELPRVLVDGAYC